MRPFTLLLISACLWPTLCLGATLTTSDTVNDATLHLAVSDTLYLNGANPDWCLVSVSVTGMDVEFTSGDSITIWVYEDDLVNDDLIFQADFEVSTAEVTAQFVGRSFECSADPLGFQDGTGQFVEIYAAAVVRKDACGTFCLDDRPETSNLDVLVLDVTTGAPARRATWLGRATPNPFNPHTRISYSLGAAGDAKLVVYDVAGRRVETLVSGYVEAGPHEVQWDGRDEQGRRVASGVYLYRLVAGEFSETKRMVLLK